MKNQMNQKVESFFLIVLLIGMGMVTKNLSAEMHADYSEATKASRQLAPVNNQQRISGCISKDNEGEFVTYNFKIGNENTFYSIDGSTNPNQGLYRTDTTYDGVSVVKRSNDNGLTYSETFPNRGTVHVYPRKRVMEGAQLAGVGVDGFAVAKMFTNSLVMDNLSVDGKPSGGKLFSNVFTGSHTCHAGNCHFGQDQLTSNDPSGTLLNYDNFVNRNRTRVTMDFGPLSLKGVIKFTDTTRTDVSTDSDGNTSSTTVVTSTKGCLNIALTRKDGRALSLAPAGEAATEDDAAVKRLIAWFETFTYDIFSK